MTMTCIATPNTPLTAANDDNKNGGETQSIWGTLTAKLWSLTGETAKGDYDSFKGLL